MDNGKVAYIKALLVYRLKIIVDLAEKNHREKGGEKVLKEAALTELQLYESLNEFLDSTTEILLVFFYVYHRVERDVNEKGGKSKRMKVYAVRELVLAKAKAERIEEEINQLKEKFDEVASVSGALDSAAKGMRDAVKAMLAMPGRVRV